MRWLQIVGWTVLMAAFSVASANESGFSTPLKKLGQTPATFVYINGTKFQLLERNSQFWLLKDLQNHNMLRMVNELVIIGAGSLQSLNQRLKQPVQLDAEPIAPSVLVVRGSIAQLRQLEQELATIKTVRTEWKLEYLPLKSQPER